MPKRFRPLSSPKVLNLMKSSTEMHVMSRKSISHPSTTKNMLALPSFQQAMAAAYVLCGGLYKCIGLGNYDKIQGYHGFEWEYMV